MITTVLHVSFQCAALFDSGNLCGARDNSVVTLFRDGQPSLSLVDPEAKETPRRS